MIVYIAGGTFIICCLASFVCYDLILQREYHTARQQWEADGSPPGFFWAPEGASLYLGTPERNRQLRRWTFWTPEWASGDERASSLFRLQRALTLVAISSWTVAAWQMFFGVRQ